MEFCYLVCCSVFDEDDIEEIKHAIASFHQECVIFKDEGVCPNGISLSCQHSNIHYPFLITEFGAPNGLCSSITKSKHIKAVKEPYCQSNHYKALSQMLLTNQHLDKLAASCVDFDACGMLKGPLINSIISLPIFNLLPEEDDGGDIDTSDIIGEVTLAKTQVYLHFMTHF